VHHGNRWPVLRHQRWVEQEEGFHVTLTVAGVTHALLTYEPNLTTIAVARP